MDTVGQALGRLIPGYGSMQLLVCKAGVRRCGCADHSPMHSPNWPCSAAMNPVQMEDKVDLQLLQEPFPMLLAGVYDGHAGGEVAGWLCSNLLRGLSASLPAAAAACPDAAPNVSHVILAQMQAAAAATAAEEAGSTAVLALLMQQPSAQPVLVVASVGNSRAILCSRGLQGMFPLCGLSPASPAPILHSSCIHPAFTLR